MLTNKQLKYLKSLHQRKFRQKYGNFIAEGVKTADEIIKSSNVEIEGVYALREWADKNKSFLSNLPPNIFYEINEKQLHSISHLKTPNQVFFVLRTINHELKTDEITNHMSLYLDEIRDPGNMGTILRIADWFGIKWVFCSEGCVEVQNPKVIQSTMGAFLRVKTKTIALTEIKKQLPELPVMGTVLDGVSVYEIEKKPTGIIVIGNESRGISKEIVAQLTHKISIPRHPDGGAESLNAGVAAGIICALWR